MTGNDCAAGDRTSHGSASARPLQTECQVSGTSRGLETGYNTFNFYKCHFTAFEERDEKNTCSAQYIMSSQIFNQLVQTGYVCRGDSVGKMKCRTLAYCLCFFVAWTNV